MRPQPSFFQSLQAGTPAPNTQAGAISNGYPVIGNMPDVSPAADRLPIHAMPALSGQMPMPSAPLLTPAPINGEPLFSTPAQAGVHQPYYPDPACLSEFAGTSAAAAPNPYSGNAISPTYQAASSPAITPPGYLYGVADVMGPGYHLPGERLSPSATPGHHPVPPSSNVQLPHVQPGYASAETGPFCQSTFYLDPTATPFGSNTAQEFTKPSHAYPAISHVGIPTPASEVHSYSTSGFPGGMVSFCSVLHTL